MEPGQTLENYLTDLGIKIGLKVRGMWAIWRNEHMSAKSRAKLEELAQQREKEKARNNDDKVAATIAHLDELARNAPSSDAEIFRAAADTLRSGNLRES